MTRNFSLAALYWGRRGALPRFALDFATAAIRRADIEFCLSVSRQNELFAEYCWLGDQLLPIDTFRSAADVLRTAPTVVHRMRCISRQLQARKVRAVIALMPHLWTPILAPLLTRSGIAYIVVAHDAVRHHGDYSGIANRWLLRDLRFAAQVVTLSRSVTCSLLSSGRVSNRRINTLFHPDLCYDTEISPLLEDRGPLRILFFGRILPYKGLPLFTEALELLARRGVPVSAAVYGSGNLYGSFKRLRCLGVKIENRWIEESEISSILGQYDLMVLSHTSASQSGVIAAAFGAGLPVVATPVGGIVDQIEHEITGLLTARVDAEALADTIERLAKNRALLQSMKREIQRLGERRSMAAFVDRLIPIAQCAAKTTAAG